MTRTAGATIVEVLAHEVEQLLSAEPAVRADAPDSVHRMRVATRRLRSVLGTYRPLFKRAPIELLRAELRWLGGVLGVARDAEVQAERMRSSLAALPAGKVRGPVGDRLVESRVADYVDAHSIAVQALDSARLADLRERLAALVNDPPLRKRAKAPAAATIAGLVDLDRRRLDQLIETAASTTPEDRVLALHDVRKGAKRLRYAAEAAVATFGPHAAAIATQAKNLQTVLGDHRDAVESRDLLDATAAEAQAAGEDPYTYRLLAKSHATAATKALRRYPDAVSALPQPPLIAATSRSGG